MTERMPENPVPLDSEFVRLFSRHAKPLYGYIASMVLNTADTDEIFQETSCILWSKFASYDRDREFLPWARGIAYFEVCSYRRKSKKRLMLSNEVVEAIAADSQLNSSQIDRREQALSTCLGKLPDNDSDLVRLRYFEQLSTKDISSKLGRSIYSIYRALTRIHNALLSCIESQLRASD